MTIAIVFAVVSAFFNAINMMTQHMASLRTTERRSGWRIARELAVDPLWLAGLGAAGIGFVLYAIALHFGPLAVVQPLLVTELVGALILRRVWIRQSVPRNAWGAAVVVSIGLTVFLLAAAPSGGANSTSTRQWIIVIAAFVVVIAGLTAISRGGSPTRKAATLGCASAIGWALTAVFIKSMTDALAAYGIVGTLLHWQLSAFVICAALSGVLQQTALHVGPLSVSQPLLVVVNPIASIVLSTWLFGERLTGDPWQLIIAIIAFAVMAAGVVVLSITTPMHIDRDRPRE